MKKERWVVPDPGSDSKQEAFLNRWSGAEGIDFVSPEAKARYEERCQMVMDVIQLEKTPSRVPVCPSAGFFPINYYGLSWKEAMADYTKLHQVFERFNEEFDPDAAAIGGSIVSGRVYEILDYKPYVWAGHGVGENEEYQYIEAEYMKADEYQDFIDDPTGWLLTTYLPRICGSLGGLEQFPNALPACEMPMFSPVLAKFGISSLQDSLNSFMKAGDEFAKWSGALGRFANEAMARGYISLGGVYAKAPFDTLGDTLRGSKEIMMDLFRRPDDVMEACERLVPIQLKSVTTAIAGKASPFVSMPLHKGADGFMSEEQFNAFYWSSLRKVIIGIIDMGAIPVLFVEGSYNSRLDIINDLPKGRVVWHFDKTDMKQAKQTVGKNQCIMGNVPTDLLYAGTVAEVEEYCKNLIDTAGKGGGFIFSTGGGIQYSKPENVKAMIECGKTYGRYS